MPLTRAGWLPLDSEVFGEYVESCVVDRMQFKPVLTKSDFVRRYKAGEFGNASPTWNTFEEFDEHSRIYQSSFDAYASPKYHLRNRIAGGSTHYNLSAYYCYIEWLKEIKEGRGNDWYCSMMAPTHLTTFQGEVQRTHRGLALFYSCQRKTMREALAFDGKQVYGVVAKYLLEYFLPTVDYEWLMSLLDRYPDHVVEFSIYNKPFGTIPNHKTVFWEVRKY